MVGSTLKKCAACGREVSQRAHCCPHCAHPTWHGHVVNAIVLGAIVFLFSMSWRIVDDISDVHAALYHIKSDMFAYVQSGVLEKEK